MHAAVEAIRSRVTEDGYCLRYRAWQAGASDTLVVTLHGVLSHSGWFGPLAGMLVERGVHVIGHDRRGSGLNQDGRGDVDGPGRLLDDLRAVVGPYRERYRTIVYLGWCLGSTIALRHLLAHPELGEGLLLMSPDIYERHVTDEVRATFASPHWDGRVIPRLRVPIPLEAYTDGPALQTIRGDALKLKDFTPRFLRATLALRAGIEEAYAAFRAPSRLLLAGRDTVVDNEKTSALYERIGSADRGSVVFDTNHGILFEATGELASVVTSFASSVARRAAA
jgi:alpha-beta hydrolase superfamily lysophospholipase